jgi:hypothetical protein
MYTTPKLNEFIKCGREPIYANDYIGAIEQDYYWRAKSVSIWDLLRLVLE